MTNCCQTLMLDIVTIFVHKYGHSYFKKLASPKVVTEINRLKVAANINVFTASIWTELERL